MCWSLEVSLATGIMVYTVVPLLWYRNKTPRDRFNAMFLSVFGTMQWVDTTLWLLNKSEDLYTCSNTNKWLSRWGLTVTAMEPFGALFGRAYSDGQWPLIKELAIYVFIFTILPGIPNKVFGMMGKMCDSPACTILTPSNNLFIGAGHGSNGNHMCWMKYHFFGEAQLEIPLMLRVFFLLGMVYPYLTAPRYIKPGIVHSLVLTITWTVGLYSESHASMWCLANVAHAIVMLFDPYMFPSETTDPTKSKDTTKETDISKNNDTKTGTDFERPSDINTNASSTSPSYWRFLYASGMSLSSHVADFIGSFRKEHTA